MAHNRDSLNGVHVIVAGAGLAGLVAARELSARGARVSVFDARQRTGGRVFTVRLGGPGPAVHAEAGGELVDAGHRRLHRLARALGVGTSRVLRSGFGSALAYGGRTHVTKSQRAGWRELQDVLADCIEARRRSGEQWWRGTAASALATRSLQDLLDQCGAPDRVRAIAEALRGFFAADPVDLGAVAALDQLASPDPGSQRVSRIRGGASTLVAALERRAVFTVERRHPVRRVVHDSAGARVTIEAPGGSRAERHADYVVLTLPPPLLLDLELSPPLPDRVRDALARVTMGAGTKALLRFRTPWWRARGRPLAFGTNLPVGAVWDAAGEQAQAAVLTLFAAGSASRALQAIVGARGTRGLLDHLRWLGRPDGPPISRTLVAWEHDPWARGAYAVFGPGFDPIDRDLLGRSVGRVLLAGEHTSLEAQGYMEGAVESGERVAQEIEHLQRVGVAPTSGPPSSRR